MPRMLTDYFGENTFNEATMKERLPEDAYLSLRKTIDNGEELTPEMAEIVAHAMKD
ncbi:MAG: glutamine synthetase III, partial [Spirochaetales bacterium]|nr:glutamine synthetase III [Spirochaetales bacterium]